MSDPRIRAGFFSGDLGFCVCFRDRRRPVGFPYGAAHASEIQYLFTLSNTAYPGVLSAPQQELAAAMQRDWTSLATFGTPGFGWPRFTSNSPAWLSLVPPSPQVETNVAAEHHCAFWAAAG